MKTKILLSIMALGLIMSAFGQKPTMELTFTAEDSGQYVPLDSILVENITQGGDTTIYTPDTVLSLEYSVGVNEMDLSKNSFSISQNYPNPFTEKTIVDLYLPKKDKITITIRDVLGRELTHYENTLNRGNHSFAFYPGNEKYYLLTVTGKQTSKTIKMLNASRHTINGEKCKIVYDEYENNMIGFKSQKAVNDFGYNLGDELRYTGYANTIDGIFGSDVVDDTPQTNTIYEFLIIKGLRCPGTPSVTDIDGNTYNTVQIGSQCWMAENLKTTTYRNGTSIPNIEDANAWFNLTTGAYVWCNNNISWKDLYGGLYNGYATVDDNGLCPTAWHVPTNDELTALIDFVGGTGSPHGNELKTCRQVNSPLGGNCSTTDHPRWNEHNTHYGTDDYGFSGLPGGSRYDSGSWGGIGHDGYWWSSTEFTPGSVWLFNLSYFGGYINPHGTGMRCGFSVRCIRD